MKIGDVFSAWRLSQDRQRLIEIRDRWELKASLTDGFTSERLDDEVLEQIRPIVTARLNEQIAETDIALQALGVVTG